MAVARPKTPRVVALLPLVALVVSAGCEVHSAARRSVYRDTASVEVADAASVEVRIRAGSVAVASTDADRVEIDLEVWLRESRPETDAVKSIDAHLVQTRSDGVLQLLDGHRDAHDAADWELRLTIRVPSRVGVRVAQELGTVRVELAAEPAANVDVALSTGHVAVLCPAEFHGEVDLAVTTGSIDLRDEWKLAVERRLTSAIARGRVGKGGARLRVEVGTGSVSTQ